GHHRWQGAVGRDNSVFAGGVRGRLVRAQQHAPLENRGSSEKSAVTASIEIQPVLRPPAAVVRPPGSKSLTNRAPVCPALAQGSSTLRGVLDSEDTRVMAAALGQLGIQLNGDLASGALDVTGCAGKIPAGTAELYVANSGTTVRFLTALTALGHG